ncbi:hypothetical protein GCM10018781_47410 [Kitasatospora indigofera]|uniref:Uncharacterized protein n=1 Tax=Kitasatospora indigofera TaxID=67307 RepID=A0A919KY48_9ACTN|nr:hypothetical protein GCM10018781_47410 [Kitasatospora indigofera]
MFCREPPWSGMAVSPWDGAVAGRGPAGEGGVVGRARAGSGRQPIDSRVRPLVSLMQKATNGMDSRAKQA